MTLVRRLFVFALFTSTLLSAQQKELRVFTASPQGVTTSIDQSFRIIVTFSEPMTALTVGSESQGPFPLELTPSVKGTYRWLGTTTLAFIPSDTLPFATAYTATVPAGTHAISGAELQQPYTWTFETPRPSIVRMLPSANVRYIEGDRPFLVVFNLPIDLNTVGKWISIKETTGAGNISYPSYTLRKPTDEELSADENTRRARQKQRALTMQDRQRIARERECALVIVPSSRFRNESEVLVICKEGLTSKSGPLGMKDVYAAAFRIYGDLKFLGVNTDQFYQSGWSMHFLFSNPVIEREFRSHIKMTPADSLKGEGSENYWTEKHTLPFTLKPETEYSGRITKGLKDIYGNVLDEDVPFSGRTSSYAPSIKIESGSYVLEAHESNRIRVSLMNCDSLAIVMGYLEPDKIVPFLKGTNIYDRAEWSRALLDLTEKSKRVDTTWHFSIPSNQLIDTSIGLDGLLGEKHRGIAILQLREPSAKNQSWIKSIVQVTDIGLTVKFSPDSILILATHLKDASVIEGAEVELRTGDNALVWSGRTDARGMAVAAAWETLGIEPVLQSNGGYFYGPRRFPGLWVIVKKDGDCTVTSSERDEHWLQYKFETIPVEQYPKPERYEAVLFTDRGLYKAGDTVNAKGIVRRGKKGAWHSTAGRLARITVFDPQYDELLKKDIPLDEFSSFALAIPTKPSAPTGSYSITAMVHAEKFSRPDEEWIQVSETSFRIEAFRPAEFEVRASFDRNSYTIGDTIRGFLNAQYLFGAPMKNMPLKWRMSSAPASFTPKGYEAYMFGSITGLAGNGSSPRRELMLSGAAVLDEHGSTAVATPLSVNEYAGVHTLTLEAEGASASNQFLSGRSTVMIHGGEYYVGLRPSSTYLAAKSPLTVSLVAVTKDGALVENRSVAMKFYRCTWRSVLKTEPNTRFNEWETTRIDSLVDSVSMKTTREPSQHRFTPSQPGFYYVGATSVDDRGDTIATQASLYVTGSGRVVWGQDDANRIDLVADRTIYAPGDRAKILVKNPFPRATALVSIEREGILSHFTTVLEGNAPIIAIPIEHAYLPNVFISVVLLQGCGGNPTDAEPQRPSFKIGCIKLSVSPKEKQLHVSVETSHKDYHPGDTVSAAIIVRNDRGAGVKSELAVSAADLGVLTLIDYHLPDPFRNFYRERSLGVSVTDSRMHLISLPTRAEVSVNYCMVAGNGVSGVRKDFGSSAYWNPSLQTDDSGRVTVRFKLPDNITAFNLMAVAQTLGSEFGEGETSFTVSKPLVLQPSLPRLARAGDTFDAGVVVINNAQRAQTVSLTAAASGITLLNANDTMHVRLSPGESREVTFRFSAEKIGRAVVTFNAESAEARDGLQWSFPISAARVKESTALFHSSIDDASEEELFIPESVVPDEGEVEVTVASTGLMGLSGGMNYLFTYPYGCLEQRASSVLPIILAGDLVDAFRYEVFKYGDYKEIAQRTIDELPLFQFYDGGFSYWKGGQKTSPYLSAYAVLTLLEAKGHGYSVRARPLERGLDYLARVLKGEVRDRDLSPGAEQCTRALILYVLARAEKADNNAMNRLFSEGEAMPLFAKAYLMRAAALKDPHSGMVNELARDLMNHVKVDPTGASFEEPNEKGFELIFHSNTRTTAIILQALIETNQDAALSERIVRRLLNVQRNGRWRTTQENLYVVSALASYFKKYEEIEPKFRAQIALDGKILMKEMFEGRSLETKKEHIPLASLLKGKNLPVAIEKKGLGRLYYGIRMNYLLKDGTAPKNEGLTIFRSMEPVDSGRGSEIRTGMVMKVTVNVLAQQDRHYVAVDDPVPAGFEVVATTFITSDSRLKENDGAWSRFNHVERYDDRVSLFADYLPAGVHSYSYYVRAVHAGTFTVPPTHAECMYEPEVFGSTASGMVTIQK